MDCECGVGRDDCRGDYSHSVFAAGGDSVAFAVGHHTVEGNVVDFQRGERTAQVTLGDIVIDDEARSGRVLADGAAGHAAKRW